MAEPKVRVEWGVEQATLKDGGREVFTVPSREFGELRVAHGFFGPVLKRRTVVTGPWEDRDEAEAGDQFWTYLLGQIRVVAWSDGAENFTLTLNGRMAKAILTRLGDPGPQPGPGIPDDLDELRRRADEI